LKMHLEEAFSGLKAYLGEGIQGGSGGAEMNRNHGKGFDGGRASGKRGHPSRHLHRRWSGVKTNDRRAKKSCTICLDTRNGRFLSDPSGRINHQRA
ncbi:MAG TPA: hypothetical protein VFR02_10665, partial [bacterium]|nr:hypothetical protein [bacterium]